MRERVLALRPLAISAAVILTALFTYFAVAVIGMGVTGMAVAGAAAAALAALVYYGVHRHMTTGSALAGPMPPASRHRWFLPVVLGGFIACWAAGQLTALWLGSWVSSPGWEANVAERATTPMWLMLLTALILAPAGEEALIRGIVFERMRLHMPVLASALLSAALFALMHGNIIQVVASLPLGILLALVYHATGRLWVVIGLHMLFNLLALVVPTAAMLAITNLFTAVLALVLAGLAITALTLMIRDAGDGLHPEVSGTL